MIDALRQPPRPAPPPVRSRAEIQAAWASMPAMDLARGIERLLGFVPDPAAPVRPSSSASRIRLMGRITDLLADDRERASSAIAQELDLSISTVRDALYQLRAARRVSRRRSAPSPFFPNLWRIVR
jgi:hypothetical protein